MTKEELKEKLCGLELYEPVYREPNDSNCPCCYVSGGVDMTRSYNGEWVRWSDISAILNEA